MHLLWLLRFLPLGVAQCLGLCLVFCYSLQLVGGKGPLGHTIGFSLRPGKRARVRGALYWFRLV